MSKKMTHTNRKGTLYFFREVAGKRGTQIVCSQKETENDLPGLPDTHEVVESPNGQVSCRKKMMSAILPEEIALAKAQCPTLVKKGVRVAVEIKKKTIIIHSADTSRINELAAMVLRLCPGNREGNQAILENNLYFQPMLKLELFDKETRIFSVERMRWTGEGGWMFFGQDTLPSLLKKLVPHLEQESFYELV